MSYDVRAFVVSASSSREHAAQGEKAWQHHHFTWLPTKLWTEEGMGGGAIHPIPPCNLTVLM
jgi:hypothetical protein